MVEIIPGDDAGDGDDARDGDVVLREPGNPLLVSIVYYCRYFPRALPTFTITDTRDFIHCDNPLQIFLIGAPVL